MSIKIKSIKEIIPLIRDSGDIQYYREESILKFDYGEDKKFSNCNFKNAKLKKTKIDYAYFEKSDFSNAKLNQSEFYCCHFEDSNFDNSEFLKVEAFNNDFSGSKFYNVNFKGILSGSIIKKKCNGYDKRIFRYFRSKSVVG